MLAHLVPYALTGPAAVAGGGHHHRIVRRPLGSAVRRINQQELAMARTLQSPSPSSLPNDMVAPWRRRLRPGGALLLGALDLALAWHERARQRRRLRDLDDCLLEDVGIGRAEADRECREPFWRPLWPRCRGMSGFRVPTNQTRSSESSLCRRALP
jgi:uncharacterized protein YjiS (DUF1127 family)